MDDVYALQGTQQDSDVIPLILRRIAIAPHPLTVADVRQADDGTAPLDPHATIAKLVECCDAGLLQGTYDYYPKCIVTKGHCPPQVVYTITDAGRRMLAENAESTM